MMKMSQFDAFLSPLEVFDVDHWNLKGAALALIFLVLGLANTIVGLMETWLEKELWFFIINKAMFTCSVGRILVGNLWKSWRCKKNSRNIQKLLYFSAHQSSRSRNTRWESWPWKLKNPSPQNSGTLGRKLTKIWWKSCRLFCYGLMQKCKKLRDLAAKAFPMETLVFFFGGSTEGFLWSNGRKCNFFKRLNTTLTMSREPWWWAAQLV